MSKKQKRSFSETIKYLKQEEWDRFRASIDNYRDKVLISILCSTGMRVPQTLVILSIQLGVSYTC